MGSIIGCKVTLCALVWFLSSVNEGVGLQMTIKAKRLVALRTVVLLVSVGFPVVVKAAFICKVLGTQVTRI